MTYCKPTQPFQAGEGFGRVEKERGRCLCIYATKINTMSDFDLINRKTKFGGLH